MNSQHAKGFDAEGEAGEKLFDIGAPAVLANSKNSGSASVSATVDMDNYAKVQATDYKMEFDGSNW